MNTYKDQINEWQSKALTFIKDKEEHPIAKNLDLLSSKVSLFQGVPSIEVLKSDLEKLETCDDAIIKEHTKKLLLELKVIETLAKNLRPVNIPQLKDIQFELKPQSVSLPPLIFDPEGIEIYKIPTKESITKADDKNSLDETYRLALIMGITTGILFLIGGVILCLLGLTGSVEFLFEGGPVKARLWNASPGVFIAFLGLLIVWRYKPKITQETQTTKTKTERQKIGETYVSSRIEKHEHKSSGARLAERR